MWRTHQRAHIHYQRALHKRYYMRLLLMKKIVFPLLKEYFYSVFYIIFQRTCTLFSPPFTAVPVVTAPTILISWCSSTTTKELLSLSHCYGPHVGAGVEEEITVESLFEIHYICLIAIITEI